MEFINVLKNRRSNRNFLSEPVAKEALDAVLLAANSAPIGSNQTQDIHLTVVQNRDILLKLGEAVVCRRKNPEIEKELVSKVDEDKSVSKADPFYNASTAIIVSHRKQDFQPGIEFANVMSVVYTMHLAATDLGLGSVMIWGVLEAMRMLPEMDHTDLLELPEGFEPLMGIALGYTENQRPPREIDPQRLSVNYIK